VVEYHAKSQGRVSPRSKNSVDTYLYICRLSTVPGKIRMTPQTLLVLETLLAQAEDWLYGYDLSRETGLKSGTLYPILIRLAHNSLLETRWEHTEPGRPPRHMYRLTPNGSSQARRLIAAAAAPRPVPLQAGKGYQQ